MGIAAAVRPSEADGTRASGDYTSADAAPAAGVKKNWFKQNMAVICFILGVIRHVSGSVGHMDASCWPHRPGNREEMRTRPLCFFFHMKCISVSLVHRWCDTKRMFQCGESVPSIARLRKTARCHSTYQKTKVSVSVVCQRRIHERSPNGLGKLNLLCVQVPARFNIEWMIQNGFLIPGK